MSVSASTSAAIKDKILILDFGSQYTQLIARRVRELRVYCEIHPYNMPLERVERFDPRGIILSGGPSSVYDKDAPKCDPRILDLPLPLLGVCYGMQLLTLHFGGEVARAQRREYGRAELLVRDAGDLFRGFVPGDPIVAWMSHGDRIERLPAGFDVIAHSENSPYAAVRDEQQRVFGVQFHPEVVHTPQGSEIIDNFVHGVCGCGSDWTMHNFIEVTVEALRSRLSQGRVVLGLSGGVDSSVVALLLHRAIGDRLTPIFVNNGVLRLHEAQKVQATFRDRLGVKLVYVDAEQRFLDKLAGVIDPEQKRKVIGGEFIAVFEECAAKLDDVRYLAQGTLYPDVIESVSFKGPSATIKSHHNVGGLPDLMSLELVEPLRELFKDEVRELGIELGLTPDLVWRHPFPGPGLAVRIVGEVTRERVQTLQLADHIITEEIEIAGLGREVWQEFGVLLPVKSVGVMGDERTYESVLAVRAVTSRDGMTADWARLPHELLGLISNRIINEVEGINRVVYDISSKPPSTIEWE
ncbi:MAG: glutamine-hydrolyzing GMP synthase [Candidatus Alcyoniella australis]|nr:glutamine-hydrolyzing GMP synthase [Candidatus Alcyoniella australis]